LNYGVHVYYCSKACQQSDWKVHKKICGPKYDGTLDILGKMTLDSAGGPSSRRDSSSFIANRLETMENMTDEQLEAMTASMPGDAGMPWINPKMAKQAASLMKNMKPEAKEGMMKILAAEMKDVGLDPASGGAPSADAMSKMAEMMKDPAMEAAMSDMMKNISPESPEQRPFSSDVWRFISSWVDINFDIPGANCTMLHVAAEEGSEEAVRALIAAGADVNRASICEQGFTPLNIAAQGGFEPVAQALIDAGADVNKANKSGVTPMRLAAHNGHEAVIRALIAAGAVEDEATKILRHRNAMQQLLQGMSGSSLPEMLSTAMSKASTAEGIHAFNPRTGRLDYLGTGEDAAKALLKGPKDRSGGRE
jgi:hypothetical protein